MFTASLDTTGGGRLRTELGAACRVSGLQFGCDENGNRLRHRFSFKIMDLCAMRIDATFSVCCCKLAR